MRRSLVVAAVVLVVAIAMALWRTADDIGEENAAALALAQVVAQLATLPTDDAAALARLQALQEGPPMRHLAWRVRTDDGRLLLQSQPLSADGLLWRWLLAAHRAIDQRVEPVSASWPVARGGGRGWTVTLTPSAEAERREALSSLVEGLLLLALALVGLLAVMRWNLRHALAPLGDLLASIRGIEADDRQAVQRLPTMPVAELETLAAALRHLGHALDDADARRRVLSAQLLTLQEDERARLARELHDEFGQRLTAMRVDARWLARQLAGLEGAAEDRAADAPDAAEPARAQRLLPRMQGVVEAWAQQCGAIQQDIRLVLARLDPFPLRDAGQVEGLDAADRGGAAADDPAAGEPLHRLQHLLHALVQGWAGGRADAERPRPELVLSWLPEAGARAEPQCQPGAPGAALDHQGAIGSATGTAVRPWPTGDGLPQLPRALALTLYRISQEALTNVARHAQASRARLCVQLLGPVQAGGRLRVDWWVVDDGLGLRADLAQACQRGSGLAGLRDRVWALGAELQVRPAAAADLAAAKPEADAGPQTGPPAGQASAAPADRPGLWLGARFDSHWLP